MGTWRDRKGEWSLQSWDGRLDRSRFDCGEPALNQWLREHAGQSERRDTARTFLAVDGADIVGYFSLGVTELAAGHTGISSLDTRYPIPALRLSRLAVDSRHQGSGLGSMLLAEAVRIAHDVLQLTATQVFLVEAIRPEVVGFYAKQGFRSFTDDPLRLYVTSGQIRASVSAVGG